MYLKLGKHTMGAMIFFSGLLGACAHAGQSPRSGIAVQEIMMLWTAIERSYLIGVETSSPFTLTREVDDFSELVQALPGSQMRRIYRYIPLSNPKIPAPPSPREVEEVLPELIQAFKESVLRDDRERTLALMMDIHESLVYWQWLDLEVEKFAGASYFSLFLIFTFFIAAAALPLWFLHRALERSLSREQAGSVFSRALVLAQEQERSRIAGELHDTVAQDLRYLTLRVGKISRTAGAAERESLCREVAAAQESLMSRVREICDGLVPPDFRFQGLPDALRRLCYDFGGRTGIDCRIDVAENLRLTMDEEMQLQTFRIVQEALTNVEKHAGATETVVTLRNSGPGGKGRGIFISVSDDGQGFLWKPGFQPHTGPLKLKAPPEGMDGHFGIRSMFERCAILKGVLVIESEAGEGTIVCLEVPLEVL
jgi:signal transduction histidine kinase